MKKNILSKIFFVLALCLSVTHFASASVLYSQGIDTDAVDASNGGSLYQSLGTGLTGTVKSLEFKLNVTTASGTLCYMSANLHEFSDSGMTTNVAVHFDDASNSALGVSLGNCATGLHTVDFVWTSGVVLNASHWYKLEVASNYCTGGGCTGVANANGTLGSNSTTTNGGTGYALTDSVHTGSSSYYYNLGSNTTPDPIVPPDTTNRVTLESPIEGATTGSTSVTLSGNYYVDSSTTFSTGAFIGVDVRCTPVTGPLVLAPVTGFVSESTMDAYTAWSKTITLVTATRYTCQSSLEYGSTDLYFSHPAVTFAVGSDPLATIGSDCTGSSFTCSIFDLLNTAFVPNPAYMPSFSEFTGLMQTKFPFAYFYQVQTIVTGSLAGSTSLPNTGVIDMHTYFSASTVGAHKFDFFNATSLQAICNSGNGCSTFISGLLTAILWVAFVFMIYRQII